MVIARVNLGTYWLMQDSPIQNAKQVGLRYVSDRSPGIRRQKWGRGFSYFDPSGNRILDKTERDRLKQLPVPPSWQDVWICPCPNGHLQATGRDQKGRKQYRYHPKWHQIRNQVKFDRLVSFGQALPIIRSVTQKHLSLSGLPRRKVLALVVQLLEQTLIRVGNVAYAKENRSYGLTTLRTRHVDVTGNLVEFEFCGKSGVDHCIAIKDKQIARIVQRCSELPGYSVFQYLDEDGTRQRVDSDDVNGYLQTLSGEDFTAKEFRTWAGTVLTTQTLGESQPDPSETKAQQQITAAIKAVAKRLGNRPATCRKYYVHPKIPEFYLTGELSATLMAAQQCSTDLSCHELAVLRILEK